MQFKVPQNVEREDQILPFLTITQLGILAAGGGLAYVAYTLLSRAFFIEIWAPVIIIIMGITAAIAFVRINGVSFLKWFLLSIEYHFLPRKRVWRHKGITHTYAEAFLINVKPPKPKKATKSKTTDTEAEPETPQTINELMKGLEKKQKLTVDKSDPDLSEEESAILDRLK